METPSLTSGMMKMKLLHVSLKNSERITRADLRQSCYNTHLLLSIIINYSDLSCVSQPLKQTKVSFWAVNKTLVFKKYRSQK